MASGRVGVKQKDIFRFMSDRKKEPDTNRNETRIKRLLVGYLQLFIKSNFLKYLLKGLVKRNKLLFPSARLYIVLSCPSDTHGIFFSYRVLISLHL